MSKKNRQRAMELEAAEPVAEMALEEAIVEAPKAEEAKVDFEAWYGLRKAAIPAIHKKEIIKADFKARKLPVMNTVAEFDEALKKYGVKLA